MGFTREVAARYSFLLAIPAVLASALLEAKDIGTDSMVNWPATLVATVVAGLVGYLVIARLMSYLKTQSFVPFVIYRVILGLSVAALVGAGVIAAS
jgi:undecaprenyl-diphosphatase